MKAQKNPLQEVYKLIMNSSYGKTLLKPLPDEIVFKTNDNIDDFVDKHYNRIKKFQKLNGSNENYERFMVEIEKGINQHYNNASAGCEVLAMSKRIMNEVMCLAEDENLNIYYQDTDSMHLDQEHIKILAEKYEEKYDRELIGKNMGRFHSDFKSYILTGNIKAVNSIYLGKKAYINKLSCDEKDLYDYHIRLKGVPDKSIIHKSKIKTKM